MRITLKTTDLLSLLSKTPNIVERRNTMPVLMNVLLEAGEGVLKVFATDLEISLLAEVPCRVERAGRAAVSAKSFFELAKELPGEEVQLTRQENNWLEIRQNRSVFNIAGVHPDEYPVFSSYSVTEFMSVDSELFLEMIERSLVNASMDDRRYHLNGIFFQRQPDIGPNVYRMVATDGYKLSRIDRKFDVPPNDILPVEGMIIPRKGLIEVRKMLEEVEKSIDIAVESSQLVVRNGRNVLMIRLIEGRYPNYQQLIPAVSANRARVSREHLISVLKRVSLLSSQKYKGVLLNFSPKRLELSSHSPEIGDAHEEVELEYNGVDLRLSFNARYLMEALTSFSEPELEIILNQGATPIPIVLRPPDDSSSICVVMPLSM